MSPFLIRPGTFQWSNYPIVLTRLGGPSFRPNPLFKIVEVQGIEPATSWQGSLWTGNKSLFKVTLCKAFRVWLYLPSIDGRTKLLFISLLLCFNFNTNGRIYTFGQKKISSDIREQLGIFNTNGKLTQYKINWIPSKRVLHNVTFLFS